MFTAKDKKVLVPNQEFEIPELMPKILDVLEENGGNQSTEFSSKNKGDQFDLEKLPPSYESTSQSENAKVGFFEGSQVEAAPVVSWNSFGYGLFFHYLFQAFIFKTLFSIIYPFYANYLNLDSHQYAAARTLPLVALALRTLIGVMSDVRPIFGQRRKPYMVLGLGCAIVPLIAVTFKSIPKPFYEPVYTETDCYLNRTSVYNEDAKQEGLDYVIMNTLAILLLSFADVAADGLKIEYSQKERVKERGTISVIIHLFLQLSTILSVLFTGILMNGVEYGGDFCFSISYQTLSAVMTIAGLCGVLNCLFCLKDQNTEDFWTIKQKFIRFWIAFQSREVLQIFVVVFFWAMSLRITSPASVKVKKNWAQVTPLITTVSTFVATGFEIIGILILKKFFLNSSWRKIFLFSRIVHLLTEYTVEFLTIFNVVRNPYFYFADDILSAIPEGMGHLVGSLMLIEICPPGLEALFHSLLISSFHTGSIIGQPIANSITAPFLISSDDRFHSDTDVDRQQVALSFVVTLIVQTASLTMLRFLPSQKKSIATLRAKKLYYPKLAATFLTSIFVLFVVAFGMSVATLHPKTACHKLLGGKGCL